MASRNCFVFARWREEVELERLVDTISWAGELCDLFTVLQFHMKRGGCDLLVLKPAKKE